MKRILALSLVCVLLLTAAPAAYAEETDATAADVTSASAVTVPESVQAFSELLTDGAANTYAEVPADGFVTATVPETPSAGLVLKWAAMPTAYTLTVRDAGGQTLSSETVVPVYLNMYHALPETAASVAVTAAEDFCLSELVIYGAGALPGDVQRWETPQDAPDVLLVAAYPGNVLECFGGLYPQLVADGVKTDVLYMSWRTRLRAEEALSALWALGQTRYPYCLGREDRGANDQASIKKDWDSSNTRIALGELLTRIGAHVIVTHGRQGDTAYDTEAARFTAAILPDALERLEGGYRPDKVYYHEAGEGATVLSYDAQLWAYGGLTAVETAQSLFSQYRHVKKYLRTITADNAYLLAVTHVGADTGASLLENVAFTPLFTPAPSPSPTPEPTSEPTPEPTATPTPEPTATPAAEALATADAPAAPETAGKAPATPLLILLGAGLLGTVVLLCLFGVLKRRRGASFALFVALLPVLVVGILAGAYLGYVRMRDGGAAAVVAEATAEPTPELTAEPTPEPTPEPTEEPTPEPTAEPTPEPTAASKWADKFSQTGEEEVVSDAENGSWSYRSDVLAVEIERHSTDEPLVWFVAHIYMRELDTFRGAIAAPNYSGMYTIPAWELARSNHAVLLITGDNLLNMNRDLKGIMIRNGKVFLTNNSKSSVAFLPETLTMQTYYKGEITARQLLQYGVENAFSFGPVLIADGVLNDVSRDDPFKVFKDNPRTGVGMIEPGHFVAIVVDGRQANTYSNGNTLAEFAQMFVDEGCVEAYNLDGGVSATMVFMGEQVNRHGNKKKDWDAQRSIPDALIWGYSNNVPSVDDPVNGGA